MMISASVIGGLPDCGEALCSGRFLRKSSLTDCHSCLALELDVRCFPPMVLERGGLGADGRGFGSRYVRTGIIEPHARALELPLLVRSGSFFFFFCPKHGPRESIFAVRSTPYPREGISDVFVRGSIIPVLKVIQPSRSGVGY